MRIFISYRRADSIGHAGRLYDELQSRFGRDNVFMDLSGIDAGENFPQKIDSAIRTCDALVAVIGDEWLSVVDDGVRRLDRGDDFVRIEIAAALERGIPVVPVLVEGATMPAAQALPDPLKPLATRNALELSDARWSFDVDRLAAALEKLAGRSAPVSRRRMVIGAAVAVLAIAAGVVAIGVFNSGDAPLEVAGEWQAEVTYSWGAKYNERFSLKLAGDEILGTASFLGVPRGIVGGTVEGRNVAFETRTQEILGDADNPRDVVHRYRGTIGSDGIAFVMQTAGSTSDVPVEFVAKRSP
jgi:hypothetical protein